MAKYTDIVDDILFERAKSNAELVSNVKGVFIKATGLDYSWHMAKGKIVKITSLEQLSVQPVTNKHL